MGYACSACRQQVPGNIYILMSHIRRRHPALMSARTFTSPMTCGQNGCLQTFRYSHTFKRHIENKHQNVAERENEQDNSDDVDNLGADDAGLLECANINQPDNSNLTREEVTELAASTIAKMKASSSVVQSTIENFLLDSSGLFSQIVMSLKKLQNRSLTLNMLIKMTKIGKIFWNSLSNSRIHLTFWRRHIYKKSISHKMGTIYNHEKCLLHMLIFHAITQILVMLIKFRQI